MSSVELLAAAAGLGSGLAAAWLSTVVSRWFGDSGFWRRLADAGRSLLSLVDDSRSLGDYLRLYPALFKLTAKTLAILVIALSPVVLAFAGLTALAVRFWDPNADYVEVAPPQPLVVELAGKLQHLDEHNARIPSALGLDAPAAIAARGGRLHCPSLLRKQAYPSGPVQRLLLVSLGFEILKPQPPFDAGMPSLLLRPSSGDGNLLWPYLSDWEFAFFAAVGLASAGGLLVMKSKA